MESLSIRFQKFSKLLKRYEKTIDKKDKQLNIAIEFIRLARDHPHFIKIALEALEKIERLEK